MDLKSFLNRLWWAICPLVLLAALGYIPDFSVTPLGKLILVGLGIYLSTLLYRATEYWQSFPLLLEAAMARHLKKTVDSANEQIRALAKQSEGEIQSVVKLLSPEQVIKLSLDIPNLPLRFNQFLGIERTYLENGFRALREHRVWPLTTARLYEAVIELTESCEKLDILDQDIRRWAEVATDGVSARSNTSTTFNYSVRMLKLLAKRVARGGIVHMRRTFVINEALRPAFVPDDPVHWDSVDPIVRALVVIWAFEDEARQNTALTVDTFSSRVLFMEEAPLDLRSKIDRIHDVVCIDEDLVLREMLSHADQRTNQSSDDTESLVCAYTDVETCLEGIFLHAKQANEFEFYETLRGTPEVKAIVDSVRGS